MRRVRPLAACSARVLAAPLHPQPPPLAAALPPPPPALAASTAERRPTSALVARAWLGVGLGLPLGVGLGVGVGLGLGLGVRGRGRGRVRVRVRTFSGVSATPMIGLPSTLQRRTCRLNRGRVRVRAIGSASSPAGSLRL